MGLGVFQDKPSKEAGSVAHPGLGTSALAMAHPPPPVTSLETAPSPFASQCFTDSITWVLTVEQAA